MKIKEGASCERVVTQRPLTPGSYQQYISTWDDDLHRYVWVSLGSTATDLTAYMKKIDGSVIERQDWPNPDIETKVLYPTAPSVPGAINELATMIDKNSKYDYTNNKITGLNTYHKTNIISALSDVGDLSRLENWDPTTETPATLVDAINIANKTYNLETQSVIDRTKYIDVKKLKVDNHDGTGYVQVGEDIKEDRVDLYNRPVPEASTSFVDYRTYDVRVANSFYDPNDATQNPYGAIHIPKVQLKKEEVRESVIDNIIPAEWVNTMPNDYEATVELSHIPVVDKVEPIVQLSPETGGSKHLVITAGSKVAKVQTLGATTPPQAGTTTATISYEGLSNSISARYFLQIEGKDYSYPISGDYIDIAADSFLKDAGSGQSPEDDKPLPGMKKGDWYLYFVFQKSDGTITTTYIPLKDIVHDVEGIEAIKVALDTATNKNKISLKLDTTNPANTLTQSDDGLKIAKATDSQVGVERFATSAEVLAADSQFNAVRPFDIHEFVNKSDTVKDDLNNFYKESGEIINNTVIKAVNELSTETITKNATADAKDVATYTYKRIPETGKEFALSTLHDLRQVWEVDAISTIVNPQPYEIYYLRQIDGAYIQGLYMYDDVKLAWISVDGNVIIDCETLPTPGSPVIDSAAIYRLNDNRTIANRYTLSAAAIAQGYYVDELGIHNHAVAPIIDYTYDYVIEHFDEFLNDEIVQNDNGELFVLQNPITATYEMIYNYSSSDGALFHYYRNNWVQISVLKITDEDIENVYRMMRF